MIITERMMMIFLFCHMMGVSSACTNPLLYGFLNDNFVKVLNHLCPLLCRPFLPSLSFAHKTKTPLLTVRRKVLTINTSSSMGTSINTSSSMVTSINSMVMVTPSTSLNNDTASEKYLSTKNFY